MALDWRGQAMTRVMLLIPVLAVCPALCLAQGVTAGDLPTPIVTQNSVEICLNSRYSQHTLSKTPATAQQISNILWAAGKAPVVGAYRNIYVATPSGTYSYHPVSHSLSRHSNEVVTDGGFAIIYDTALEFDAGVMFMPALLAGVSLGRSTESPMASCPKGIGYPKTRLIFGVQAVNGLKTELAAHCSVVEGQPGWLPDPSTNGDNRLEEVLANLKYVTSFDQTDLTAQQVSQLLWAGYGCTAHMTTNGRAGLTVPSAYANYYLSRSIYLVNESGVRSYHNRNPSTSQGTRDHRLEPLGPAGGGGRPRSGGDGGSLPPADARAGLPVAIDGLPKAPCYVVLCLDSSFAGQPYAQLETGFVAGNMLIQASAMGLGCHFKPNLTSAEQKSIQAANGIPASHIPQAIVSLGPIAAAPLAGDANHDGIVDLADYVILSRSWLSSPPEAAYDAEADFNGDGRVDVTDLALLAANWLRIL